MAVQFSLKTFLRKVPAFTLMAYFQQKNLLSSFNWAKESCIDVLADAILALGEPGRAAVQDFSDIHDMATQRGTQQIIKEARGPAFNLELADDFKSMSGHLDFAMYVFMNHHDLFHWASETLSLDKLTSFKHCFVGQNLYCSSDEEIIENLAKAISEFFNNQGRGENCVVDYYERGNPTRHCFFAYSDDYKTEELFFDDDGKLKVQARRHVTEVIFVYHPDTGILDVHARGSTVIKGMQEIFCKVVLGFTNGIPDENTKIFDLSRVKDDEFMFSVDPDDGILDVSIKSIGVGLPKPRKRFVLDSDSDHTFNHMRTDVSAAVGGMEIDYDKVVIQKLKLRVLFAPVGHYRPKTVVFSISAPDGCNLGDDPRHHLIKRYLEKWGFVRSLVETSN